MPTEFRLITSSEPDLFQERLNRFFASLDPDTAVGEVQFSTTPMPGGAVFYSALVSLKKVSNWEE